MQAIPAEQYEAAAMDGANMFQRFVSITLPSLKPVIIITRLLSTIWTANSINFVFILTRGGPANATMTFRCSRMRSALMARGNSARRRPSQ
jgi:ABC-type sugar transport system permease subunit